MRRIVGIGVAAFLLTIAALYLHLTGRFAILRRTPDWIVMVNGVPVDGEVLAGRMFAVVTRRDKGKKHSYLLWYEGDVDQAGDMGQVIDCRQWIAPRLPFLIETSTYPNCKVRSRDEAHSSRMPLVAKDGVPQFLTKDGDVISIKEKRPGD
jgi:hypothetical protein